MSLENATPFVQKAYRLASDSSSQSVVSWNPEGTGIVIWDAHEFEKTVLPKHFKHSNFSSFVRQLNTYGFHKVSKSNSLGQEFQHPMFLRESPELLGSIKRKRKGKAKKKDDTTATSSEVISTTPGVNVPSREEMSTFFTAFPAAPSGKVEMRVAPPAPPPPQSAAVPFSPFASFPPDSKPFPSNMPSKWNQAPTLNAMPTSSPFPTMTGPSPVSNSHVFIRRLHDLCRRHQATQQKIVSLQSEWRDTQMEMERLMREASVGKGLQFPYGEPSYCSSQDLPSPPFSRRDDSNEPDMDDQDWPFGVTFFKG